MTATTGGAYFVGSIKISLNALQDISTALPPLLQIVVDLTKRIIPVVEVRSAPRSIVLSHSHSDQAVKGNRDLCNELRDRLLQLLLVTVMLAKRSTSPDKTTLPAELKSSIPHLQK